ncbi:futalosine hydrolase [Actinoplanes sp. N902-109]|uniref:futalosine hydrolase n=1 Tax=Actinoplanes sp. (strain N902-109) TaxID=649831 RepID=UPI0005A282FD|nr:futalosine hydrolase [Actinoplanes sp. N902-109]
MTRLLIVTAVEPEAAAIRAGLPGPAAAALHPAAPADAVRLEATIGQLEAGAVAFGRFDAVVVHPVGVGPSAAAAGTARLLALAEAAGAPCAAVISAGIAGGFAGRADLGATVLGNRSIAADLGAESPEGFLPIEELGFGSSVVTADPALLEALPTAIRGDILTLSTVTGTAGTAAALQARFPDAVAEAMEGYGVACAAQAAGLPFVEVRTISNPVGPRDRGAWRLREAFSALTDAVRAACG